MDGAELLTSFVNGFKRSNVSDIINAAYVARNAFSLDFTFDFRSRGSRGVDSSEIRRLLFFNEFKVKKNNKKAFKAAKQLSKIDSKKLGWLAQYFMNGESHLYKEEVEKALRLRKSLAKRKFK